MNYNSLMGWKFDGMTKIGFLHEPLKPHWTIGEGVLVGRGVRLGDYVILEGGDSEKGYVKIYDEVMIGNYTMIRPPVIIGSKTVISHHCVIEGHARIGYHCRIGQHCVFPYHVTLEDFVFIAGNFHYANDARMKWMRPDIDYELEPLLIKTGARVGLRTTVMPGVTIGQNSFVYGSSLVTRDVPDYAIVKGYPAKVIGEVPENEWV